MQDIFNKLSGVYEDCLALKSELQSKRSAAEQVALQQGQLSEALAKKESELVEREKELVKIEDLIQYKKDADVRFEQAERFIAETATRLQSFTAYQNAVKEELAVREQKVAKREEEVASKETHLETMILDKVKSILGQ